VYRKLNYSLLSTAYSVPKVDLQFIINSLQCTDEWQQKKYIQCTYNVTMTRTDAPIVRVDSSKF